MLPVQKGNELERAVQNIEETIVRSFPNLKEEDFDIEPKKIIVSDGVRHEIDLYVKYSLPLGYDSVFVFESKNWKKPVDKNQIIDFSEKIKVTNAQRGFFVAKSYSSSAVAQAKKDPRMEILSAMELSPDLIAIPFGFHFVGTEEKSVYELILCEAKASSVSCVENEDRSSLTSLMLDTASFELDGRKIDLPEYLDGWIEEEIDKDMSGFPSGDLPNGVYTRKVVAEKEIVDKVLSVNGHVVENIKMKLSYTVRVSRPKIRSVFDIEGRGRTIQLERLTVGDAFFDTSFVYLSKLHPEALD